MTAVTQWFSIHEKPVNVGVYEARSAIYPFIIWYSYWDGLKWRSTCSSAISAMSMDPEDKSETMYDENYVYGWRGLADKVPDEA